MKLDKLIEWFKGISFFLVLSAIFYYFVISSDWKYKQADICIRQSHSLYNNETNSIEELEVPKEWLVLCGFKSKSPMENEFGTFISDSGLLEKNNTDDPTGLSVRISCNDKIKNFDFSQYIGSLANGYRLMRDFNGDICKLSQKFVFSLEKLRPRLSKSQLHYLAEKHEALSFEEPGNN